jgi:hypothetical protein
MAERRRILGATVDVLQQDFVGTMEALVVHMAELAKTKLEGIAGTSVATNATQRAVRIPGGGF